MKLPFTTAQFFQVIENYNSTIFPMQIVWIVAAMLLFIMLLRKTPRNHTYTGIFLGSVWIWSGIVYHLVFFSRINNAAFVFGSLFVLQGIMFLFAAFRRKDMIFESDSAVRTSLAYFLIIFGIVIYPVLVYITGGHSQAAITLGLPCPTTLVTYGYLLLLKGKMQRRLFVIPFLWSMVGTTAAMKFHVYPDVMLFIAGLTTAGFVLFGKHRSSQGHTAISMS